VTGLEIIEAARGSAEQSAAVTLEP
jgi:hypothetical protein